MTYQEWDERWRRIFDEYRLDGLGQTEAIDRAYRETTEQFGERPEEQG